MVIGNEQVSEITEEEFEGILNNGHKLVVVDFFADWCMPCLMIAPIIEDLAEKLEEVKFVKINVDDNQVISSKMGIRSIPCLIFFKNGKEVYRQLGSIPEDELEEKIHKFINN